MATRYERIGRSLARRYAAPAADTSWANRRRAARSSGNEHRASAFQASSRAAVAGGIDAPRASQTGAAPAPRPDRSEIDASSSTMTVERRPSPRVRMAKFHKHIFICVNERAPDDPRGSCGPKGGHKLAEAFKKKLYERGLKRIVRPNKAGCLDQCAMGCTVVVYPEQVWYGKVTVTDVDEIIDAHILGGKPVQRLMIPDDTLTGLEKKA
jgi:(2Fe-2S) ferredoxin